MKQGCRVLFNGFDATLPRWFDRCPMGDFGQVDSGTCPAQGWARSALAKQARRAEWHSVGAAHGSALVGSARRVSSLSNVSSPISAVGTFRGDERDSGSAGIGFEGARRTGYTRGVY